MADEEDVVVDNDDPVVEETTQGDRPEWLSPKFASVEDQAKAYLHADSLIGKQGTELAELRAQLEAREELLAQTQETLYESDDVEAWTAAVAKQRAFDDENALLAIENATREAVTAEAINRVPGLAEQLAMEAVAPQRYANDIRSMLDEADPDWQRFYPRVEAEMNTNNLIPQDADIQTIASTILALTNRFRNEEAELRNYRMQHAKMMAQSARGAGTRVVAPEADAQAWNQIREAGSGTYSDRMRNR